MLHDKVLHMIKFCRCVFNNITIAIGKEIVLENDQKLLKEKWWKFKRRLFMVSIDFLKNWLYQKANNNSKAAYVSWLSERDGFLLSLGY